MRRILYDGQKEDLQADGFEESIDAIALFARVIHPAFVDAELSAWHHGKGLG